MQPSHRLACRPAPPHFERHHDGDPLFYVASLADTRLPRSHVRCSALFMAGIFVAFNHPAVTGAAVFLAAAPQAQNGTGLQRFIDHSRSHGPWPGPAQAYSAVAVFRRTGCDVDCCGTSHRGCQPALQPGNHHAGHGCVGQHARHRCAPQQACGFTKRRQSFSGRPAAPCAGWHCRVRGHRRRGATAHAKPRRPGRCH